jgi:cysteine desulfurase
MTRLPSLSFDPCYNGLRGTMVKLPIYLDHQATTPVDPRVLEAMLPFFGEKFGNAASRTHVFGWEAEEAVKHARQQVAELIGASEREVIFTSGATESNNLALKGVARSYRTKGNHLITAATEHKAVLDPCKRLEQDGFRVTVLPVDSNGRVSAEQVAEAIGDQTILVSVMAANNEIGTLQPIGEIGQVCKERGVLFHTDAAQAVGKTPIDVEVMGIDLLSISGHKMYGPKGVGALYVRRRDPRVRLEPIIDGGGHEHGLRSGTLPVPLVVGLGEACAISQKEMAGEAQRLTRLRERLRSAIMESLSDVRLNGHPIERLPGNLNLSFVYVKGEALMLAMKEVALSSGSACTSAELGPSHVLKAIGLDDETADASLRFGLGRFTTEEELDWVREHVVQEVERLRAMSPVGGRARRLPSRSDGV